MSLKSSHAKGSSLKDNHSVDDGSVSLSMTDRVNDDDEDHEKEDLKAQVRYLKQCLARKDDELEELEGSLHMALDSIKTFHEQQRSLFKEFIDLRERHSHLKTNMASLLWEYVPHGISREPLAFIPKIDLALEEVSGKISHYQLGEILGEGQFATVKSCEFADFGNRSEEYAVKIIRKDKVTSALDVQRINNEISVLKELKHENLLQLIDVMHTKENLYIVMEKGGMDLFSFYSTRRDNFEEKLAQSCIKQIVSCIDFLHHHRIAHRDLKPENILIDEKTLLVKVVDLGLSVKIPHGHEELKDFCGSPGFFAPELVIFESYDGFKVDVWSIGCILLEMVVGNEWFEANWAPVYNSFSNVSVFTEEIVNAVEAIFVEIEYCKGRGAQISNDLISILKKILTVDHNARITTEQLCMHPWIGLQRVPDKETYLAQKKLNRRKSIEPMDSMMVLDVSEKRTSVLLSEARMTPDEAGASIFGTPMVLRTRSDSESLNGKQHDKLSHSFNLRDMKQHSTSFELMHEEIEPKKMVTSNSAINLTSTEEFNKSPMTSPNSLKALSPLHLRSESSKTESPRDRSPLSNDFSPTTSPSSGKGALPNLSKKHPLGGSGSNSGANTTPNTPIGPPRHL